MSEEKHVDNIYALDVNSKEVYIGDVERGRKGYFCIGCEKEMQAVKPKTIRAYFRHDVRFDPVEKKCTYSDETYRHKLAKEILQTERKIKVPALYKYPPKGEAGEPILISKSRYVEASHVSNELFFYEDEDGEVRFGRNKDVKDRYLLVKPDVTFFDKNRKPILLIELVATHKADDEKKIKLKRLGIDAVEVTIPKDSPEAIGEAFKKSSRTKWLYSYEQDTAKYISVPFSSAEGVQSIDEFQRKLFEESFKCRAAQIRNLIHGFGRCVGSERYRVVERNLKSEISRVERNTETVRNRWREVCDRGREEAKKNISEEIERYNSEKAALEEGVLRLKGVQGEFQEHSEELEGRYIAKGTELEEQKGNLDKEERISQQSDEEITERIEGGEEAIRGFISSQESIRFKAEDFEKARRRIADEFKSRGEQLKSSIGKIEERESKELIGINRKTASISRRNRIAYKKLKRKIEERERKVIKGLSIYLDQYLRGIKNGEFIDFEWDRGLTRKVNEFAKAMAILNDITAAYKNRERLQQAYDAAKRGTYKNWDTERDVF